MTIKRMLKFALSAVLLLSASGRAYAQESTESKVVTLNNGTTTTWADFVKVINGGAVTGSTELTNAVEKAQTALTEAEGKLPGLAQKESDALKKFNDQEAQLAKWRSDVQDLNEKLKSHTATLASHESKLKAEEAKKTQLNEDIARYQRSIDSIGTVLNQVPSPWLKPIYDGAITFQMAYNNYVDSDGNDEISGGKGKIHYKTSTNLAKKTVITVTFGDKPKNDGPWATATVSEFCDFILNENTPVLSSLRIYLGEDYENLIKDEEAGVASRVYAVTEYKGDDSFNIIPDAVTALKSLAADSRFTTYVDLNAEKKKPYYDKINKANSDIAAINKTINGVKGVEGVADVRGIMDDIYDVNALIESDNNALTEKTNNINAYTAVKEGETKSEQDKLKEAYDNAKKDHDDAKAVVETKTTELATAKKALEDEQAVSRTAYDTVRLTGDVTATENIPNAFTGTIYGNGHIITVDVPNGQYLFNQFQGHLTNAAVNGKFAEGSRNASFENVALWSGASGRFYNEGGTLVASPTNLGELGFLARENFGVDFATKTLTTQTDATKVYHLTVYKSAESRPDYYVTMSGSKFINGEFMDGIEIPVNTFVETQTDDEELHEVANVFYQGTCYKAEITDRQKFYCPTDIQALKLKYNRKFLAGKNAVCVPFPLDQAKLKAAEGFTGKVEAVSIFARETPTQFWFKKSASEVKAYTPVLVNVSADLQLDTLEDITIPKTESQVVEYEGDADDPSKAFGLLQSTTRESLDKDDVSHKIYGLNKEGKFQLAAVNAVFPAFRTVIYSHNTTTTQNAPRQVRIFNEDGVDITDDLTGEEENEDPTAIETVENEVSLPEIVGGQGEIVFTAAADYGKVAIYSLDGRVAAMANVTVGTTSVNVANGLYIVMGKKVMVK